MMENPYQRSILLATVTEIKTENGHILDMLINHFPDLLKHYIDALAVSVIHWIINCAYGIKGPAKTKMMRGMKSIFRKKAEKPKEMTRRIPDPKNPGEFKEIKVIW